MSGDTLVNADTGEVIAEMTPDEARDITNRMRTAAGVLTELYVDAYTRRAWAALGHASWDAYLAAEFGDFHLRLPREERDDVIGSLRAAGLSIRAIAATGVASKNTVERTLAASGVPKEDTSIQGTDGKTYDAVSRAKARKEAEPADDDTPKKCTDGFDCPAAPGADGLCVWHRGRRAGEPKNDGSSSPSEPEQRPPAPVQDPGEAGADTPSDAAAPGDTGPSQSGAGDDGGEATSPVAPPVLPDNWRDRIACAVHLLGCPAAPLRAALTDDDRIDLTDLRDHLTDVLEKNA